MTTSTVILEGPIYPHHLPFILAQELDLVGSDEINLTATEESTESLDLLLDGKGEFALAHPLSLVSHFLDGHEVLGIARFFHTDGGLLYRPQDGLQVPSDISPGHKIASRIPEELITRSILNRAIEHSHGETLPENVEIEPLENDPINAIRDGQYDVIVQSWIVPDGVRLQIENIDGDFWYFDDYGIPSDGDIALVTTKKYAQAQPNEILNFVHGIHNGLMEARKNSDRALSIYEDWHPNPGGQSVNRALLQTSLDGFTEIFSQDYATYSSWGTFLDEEADYGGFVDLDRLIDERFLPVDAMSF